MISIKSINEKDISEGNIFIQQCEENNFFKSNINLNSCDAVINGEILKFENNFFLAYSNAKISINLYLLFYLQ